MDVTGREEFDEGSKGHPHRLKIHLMCLEITRRRDIAVFIVTVLDVLHLATIFHSPWPTHGGHAGLIQECTSPRFDSTRMRLDQAIALIVMRFTEVMFPL